MKELNMFILITTLVFLYCLITIIAARDMSKEISIIGWEITEEVQE